MEQCALGMGWCTLGFTRIQPHFIEFTFWFRIYENEIAYVERLLEEDIRNNSAWNQRFYIVTSFPANENLANGERSMEESADTSILSREILQREVNFTLNAIKRVARNESSWNYLRG